MATGGLGGVHRGAGRPFDVSADLDELAAPTAPLVVCSGVKSILDIAGHARGARDAGRPGRRLRDERLPGVHDDLQRDASSKRGSTPRPRPPTLVRAHRRLGLPGAIVLAQPPPSDLAIPRQEMEAAVAAALTAPRRGDHRQGDHPVPARRDPRRDRRPEPGGEQGADCRQRAARWRGRGGAVRLRPSMPERLREGDPACRPAQLPESGRKVLSTCSTSRRKPGTASLVVVAMTMTLAWLLNWIR